MVYQDETLHGDTIYAKQLWLPVFMDKMFVHSTLLKKKNIHNSFLIRPTGACLRAS